MANLTTALNWQDARRRVIYAYRQWLRSVNLFRIPAFDHARADCKSASRPPRSSRCTLSTCQSLRYGRKYGKNLRDIDMSISYRWWTCSSCKMTWSSRYAISSTMVRYRSKKAQSSTKDEGRRQAKGSYKGISLTDANEDMMVGNIELLEADISCDEVLPGN